MTITRFAPSPTGILHIGNIRTALFNFLLARRDNGKFVLRLDDTDQIRSKQEFVDAIYQDLEWLGLEWDKVERQSKRLDRYTEKASQLIQSGDLYECFESPEELDLKRKLQLKLGKPPVYDRESLKLSEEEKQDKRHKANGYWRFKLAQKEVFWKDGIQGEVTINTSNVSDPVLIRADGLFLYTFASVVDDLDFGITHIVRGDDHLTNTATQIEIMTAFGFTHPEFFHHSLLVGKKGEPLAKRLGDLSIRELRENGIEPEAILSQLAFLGSSIPVNLKLNLEEILASFSLESFSGNPTKFDEQQLVGLTSDYFRNIPYDVIEGRVVELGIPKSDGERFWEVVKGNIKTIAEIKGWWKVLNQEIDPVIKPEDREFVELAISLLPEFPFDLNTWKNWVEDLKSKTDRKGGRLFLPLRLAITGKSSGPEMQSVLALLKVPPIIKIQR
ncbi:MAG: glutamate--tRNA ligase [Rhodobacteraceae bacterium]|nr:glutamate--tRNA ligase [Paracoccaceae bacterium]MCY4249542.1 glutamate--tRNA ligase [Paracoccaceae bacterium]